MSKIFIGKESGRSMVEIVGVLAMMALMTVGAFVLIRNGMATQKRNTVIDDVSKIVTGIRTLYAEHDDLSKLKDKGDDALAALEISTSGPYENSVYSVNKDSSDNSRFVITIKNLPKRDCVVLATKKWPESVGTPTSSCTSGGDFKITITYDK